MDEPMTFLDIAHQLRTLELARQLAAQGKAVVMVLHDLSQALSIADTVAVMEQGHLRCISSPDTLFADTTLAEVFGVEVHRVSIGDSWHYICTAIP